MAGSDGDWTYLAGRAEMKGGKGEAAARPGVRSALRLRRKVGGLVGREEESEGDVRGDTALLENHSRRG